MNEELEASQKGIKWDAPHYYLNGRLFIPHINEIEEPKEQFNSIACYLDGTTSSHLDWTQTKSKALNYVKQGYKLFWMLDLGLFASLKRPLSNQTQYLSLELSLKHFQDYIWKDLGADSLGVCLYKGAADFSKELSLDGQEKNLEEWVNVHPHIKSEWQLSLFCQDVCLEFLEMLTSMLPDEIPLFLMLDAKNIADQQLELLLLHPERYGRLNVILKNSHLPSRGLAWDEPSLYGCIGLNSHNFPCEKPSLGICLPSLDQFSLKPYAAIAEIMSRLNKKELNFRLIPECFLITEWDELADLIVLKEFLQPQGMRKLKGFNAAGGRIIFWKEPTCLEPEISFEEWEKTS